MATDDNLAALEDLDWLEVQPDELVSIKERLPAQDVVDELVEKRQAYLCYCTPAELREMPAAPRGSREPTLYDGRCRSLSLEDQKALAKAGRKPSVRLRVADNPGQALAKRLQAHLPSQTHDFVIMESDGASTTEFAAVFNDNDTQATHTLLHDRDMLHIHQRILIANALKMTSPEFVSIADVEQLGEQTWKTISGLRDAGFHPVAVRSALLSAGFKGATQDDIREQAKSFKLNSLSKNIAQIDLHAMQDQNSSVLQDMDNNDQVDAIFEHLARRGFAFEDRDKRWRKKFVDLVVEDLNTLADAEAMAGLVLTSSVNYDKQSAEQLRDDKTQALIDLFESCIKKGKTSTLKDWKGVFGKLRAQVDVPGRALATIRLVLTGERSGPNLAVLTTLLGEDGTALRLQKARKYRSS